MEFSILMASESYFKFILFLLSLSNFSLKCCSLWNVDKERDFNRWVSWNVQNHQKKALWQAESISQQVPGAGGRVLDDKLWKAEMNKVRISVCQNGTGDFKTIREAINSIPPYNTKRVILEIKPGVYRYTYIVMLDAACIGNIILISAYN